MDLLKIFGKNKKQLPKILWLIRIFNVLVILGLIYFGWGVLSEDVRYTNFTSFVIWVIWWPMIIFMVILAGRLWCTMCHLKLIADCLDRFGLKLKPPNWIMKRGRTITIIMIAAVFVLHSSVASYDIPHFTYLSVLYLITLLVYTAVIALLFERHTFCKAFCPLIGFLGNYTRCSPTELRPSNPDKCKTCRAKECVKHCPHKLYMGVMDSHLQEGCLLCMECVKHCPNDNITFRLRSFFKGIWDSSKRSVAGTLAVIVLLGILMGEYGEEWKVFDNINLFVPNILAALTGFEEIGGYKLWESLWVFFIQPAVILGIFGAIAMIIARKDSAWNYIKIYALGLLPMLLSLHIAKHFHKFNTYLGYVPFLPNDPSGASTAAALKTGALTAPSPVFLSGSAEGWAITLFVVFFGILGALYAMWKISKANFEDDKSQGLLSVIPFMILILFLGVVFVLTIYNWLVV